MDGEQLNDRLSLIIRENVLPIALGLFGLLFLGYGFFSMGDKKDKQDILAEGGISTTAESTPEEKFITVDVEGAVIKPGVYKLKADSRVQDALIAAGGMSDEADREKVAKGLNLAAKVIDGGKLYIPAEGDELMASNGSNVLGMTSDTVNINTASPGELDALPGVGKTTAEKIIDNRPFGSVDELLSKKIVGKKVFEEIKDKVSAY